MLSLMGYRQVVRLWVLVPLFGGSNPSIPDDLYDPDEFDQLAQIF